MSEAALEFPGATVHGVIFDALFDETRLERLIAEARAIVAEAVYEHVHKPGKQLTQRCLMFSGGDDSTVLAHLFRNEVDRFVHIDTGIWVQDLDGGSAALAHVQSMSDSWGVPLLVASGESYRALVIQYGFPGPAQHFRMYNNLKERGFRKVRREFVKRGRRERILFIAGMRGDESDRREDNAERHHRDGSVVWCSPLIDWTKQDLADYRRVFDVPRSDVSRELHMSGECLCGAFAKKGELDEIDFWRPETAVHIRGLEAEVAAAGNAPAFRCQWGWGAYRPTKRKIRKTGPLCQQCVFSFDSQRATSDAIAPDQPHPIRPADSADKHVSAEPGGR